MYGMYVCLVITLIQFLCMVLLAHKCCYTVLSLYIVILSSLLASDALLICNVQFE